MRPNTNAQTGPGGAGCKDRSIRQRALLALILTGALAVSAPLLGLVLSGQPTGPYLDFPPRTRPAVHAPFSWPVFIGLAVPVLLVAALLAGSVRFRRRPQAEHSGGRRFPWWGWLGLLLIALGWASAWSAGLVPPPLRRHTFAVIWLGYILAVNGWTWRRCGACPLTHRSGWFLALFAVSAAFWWVFEYLNQFVDNWYYVGVDARSDAAYILQATVPFATVLPAIASTRAWLHACIDFRGLPAVNGHPALPWLALLGGLLGLAAIAPWPEVFYSMLWVGPLLLVGALQSLLPGESTFAPLAHGDWRPVLEPALAALLCGLLWELWNHGSAAKWHYSIPYVQRFHLFEMPLLGYAGYLPFGVLCACVMDLTAKVVEHRRSAAAGSRS